MWEYKNTKVRKMEEIKVWEYKNINEEDGKNFKKYKWIYKNTNKRKMEKKVWGWWKKVIKSK